MIDYERLSQLERDSLSWKNFGEGILHRDLDVGSIRNFPKVTYKCPTYNYPIDIKNDVDSGNLNSFYFNCQGLSSSLNYLKELCLFSDFDILALNETWLRDHTTSLLKIGNYNIFVQNRIHRQHGGLAVYVRKNFNVKLRRDKQIYQEMVFEYMVIEVCKNGTSFFVVIIYKPPSSSYDDIRLLLERQLEILSNLNRPCFFCGELS